MAACCLVNGFRLNYCCGFKTPTTKKALRYFQLLYSMWSELSLTLALALGPGTILLLTLYGKMQAHIHPPLFTFCIQSLSLRSPRVVSVIEETRAVRDKIKHLQVSSEVTVNSKTLLEQNPEQRKHTAIRNTQHSCQRTSRAGLMLGYISQVNLFADVARVIWRPRSLMSWKQRFFN